MYKYAIIVDVTSFVSYQFSFFFSPTGWFFSQSAPDPFEDDMTKFELYTR